MYLSQANRLDVLPLRRRLKFAVRDLLELRDGTQYMIYLMFTQTVVRLVKTFMLLLTQHHLSSNK